MRTREQKRDDLVIQLRLIDVKIAAYQERGRIISNQIEEIEDTIAAEERDRAEKQEAHAARIKANLDELLGGNDNEEVDESPAREMSAL